MEFNIGLGGFPDYLTSKPTEPACFRLFKTPSMSELISMDSSSLKSCLSRLNSFSHVVFRLSGENPMEFIQILRIRGALREFTNRKYSVSFWTMDSHHLGIHESKAAKYFDHVFVAHKNYLDFFDSTKTSLLPCSFSLLPAPKVPSLAIARPATSTKGLGGIAAPFTAYPWQKRNLNYAKALRETTLLNKQDFFFGTVHGGTFPNEAIVRKLLSYKVILNFSLAEDLNMRNFEALALNRILVTNKVTGHELLSNFQSNIVYVDNHLENLKAALQEALAREPADISQAFLAEHSIEARVTSMLKFFTGDSEAVDLANSLARSKPGEFFLDWHDDVPVQESPHTVTLLIGRSGWIPVQELIALAEESNRKWVAFWELLSIWTKSFGFHVLSSSFGRSSTLRALFRLGQLGFVTKKARELWLHNQNN